MAAAAHDLPMYICGHIPNLLEKAVQRMRALGFRPKAVVTERNEDPVKGCIDAHGKMAAVAAADGNAWYVGVEQNVEATRHFRLEAVHDAILALNELQLDVVMLSTFALPFYFFNQRAHRINGSVWKKVTPTCERSQAAVYRTAFAQRLAQQEYTPDTIVNAWDFLILPQYVTYKAPFQRTLDISTTTIKNNDGLRRKWHEFTNQHFSCLEDVMHHQVTISSFVVAVVLFMIVVVVLFRECV